VEAAKGLHAGVGIVLIAPGAGAQWRRGRKLDESGYIVLAVPFADRPLSWKERSLKVLKLSAQGLPQSWISLEQAVLHYAADEVRWEVGAQVALFRGGHNAMTGEQSVIAVSSIIGTKGVPNINPFDLKPGLTNGKLFSRDRNVCAYCGGHFHEEELTREHIIPFAQNGKDHWMNVVTACRACNHRKSNRTPEQAHMPLLYAPYVPSLWEDFILRNRRILADQMEFLMAHLPKSSRLHC
jgi:hypothetical protein